MGRGRKKKSVHPGQPCGPCNLCNRPSIHYCHIATCDENLKRKIRAITAVSDEQCICRACEGDFKQNSGKDGYRFRWMPEPGNFSGSKRCIVSSCTETGTIIHTSITTRDKVADLLHEQVLSEPKSLFTPLCASHYRKIHRLLHSDDDMYAEKRCCTCNAWIHGMSRHCPNPEIVQQYFSQNDDTDVHTTDKDYICTTCYNFQLLIIQDTESRSTDSELEELLSSQQLPALWSDSYPPYITAALKEIIRKLGEMLLKSLAVLFPDVYKYFTFLATNEAKATSESEIKKPFQRGTCVGA